MAGGLCRERRQRSRTTRWRGVTVGSSGAGRVVRGGGWRHTRAMRASKAAEMAGQGREDAGE
eukprot:2639888-Prymnesium_polylepis.1